MNINTLRPQIKVKTHRIYLESILKDEVLKISDNSRINYLKNVLRLKNNSLIRIFDQSKKEYLLRVIEIQNKYVLLEKIELLNKDNNRNDDNTRNAHHNAYHNAHNDTPKDSANFTAGICILKPEKMRESVDAATQMGVGCIQPIISDRCQNFFINLDKIKIWAIEASEQSERLCIPAINNPMKLHDFVETTKDKIIVANEHFGIRINDFFKEAIISSNASNVTSPYDTDSQNSNFYTNFHNCIIGPEGGFSDKDLANLNSPNIINVNLGSNILKSHIALVKILSFFCQN